MNRVLLLFFLFSAYLGLSQRLSAPKYVNEFLSIGQGARGLGMGNTQAAIVNDATAGYWNPAGLLHVKDKYAVTLMHSENFAGIVQNDYAAFTTEYDSSSRIGISVIRVGVDDIPNTINLIDDNGVINYDNVTSFGVSDYAFTGSYAKKSNLIKGLSLGVNAKIIYRHVGPFANAWGFGMDVGGQFERNGWQFGIMARDVTTTTTYWTYNTSLVEDVFLQTNNDIPQNSAEVALPRIILGTGKEFVVKNDFYVLGAVDIDLTTDGKRNTLVKTGVVSLDPHAGIEISYKKIVYLRGGFNNFQKEKGFVSYLVKEDGTYDLDANGNRQIDESSKTDDTWVFQPNFGIGLNIKKINIDYALTRMATQQDGLYSHIFSVNFIIN